MLRRTPPNRSTSHDASTPIDHVEMPLPGRAMPWPGVEPPPPLAAPAAERFGERAEPGVLAEIDPVEPSRPVERRQPRGAGFALLRPRGGDPAAGGGEVEVAGDRAVDQARQHRIAELRPPTAGTLARRRGQARRARPPRRRQAGPRPRAGHNSARRCTRPWRAARAMTANRIIPQLAGRPWAVPSTGKSRGLHIKYRPSAPGRRRDRRASSPAVRRLRTTRLAPRR